MMTWHIEIGGSKTRVLDRVLQGCPRVGPGWVCAQLGPDLKLSGESKQNPKPTRNASRIGRFRSRRVFEFIGQFWFYLRCRYFGRIHQDLADIQPNPLRSGQITTRSHQISTRSRRILSDLDQISTRFRRISSNLMGFK